ncbi:hypothetical protein [Apilactobacillus ozensis]|uniref:hypothetical protein n=1 Tax=Apilactobacillus ozensis TaxID=866801 RepID=UPI0006D23349|nr:hypothetical protein [Apilactobacillus ozensis]
MKLPDSARFNMVMYETSDDKSAKQAETKTFIIKDNTYYILSKILSDKLQHDYTVIDQIAEILTRYTSDEPKAKALKRQLGEKLSDEKK